MRGKGHNLTSRSEQSGGKNLSESFLYDGMNRLTSYQVAGQAAKTVSYNAIGNITHKSDVGTYSYGAGNAGPHAVTSISGTLNTSYTYDANGNNITGDGRTIAYSTFDKPTSITKGSHTTSFEYGPDRARYKRVDQNSSGTKTTLYVGGVEFITNPDNSKEVKRYVAGTVITLNYSDAANDESYTGKTERTLFHDHLGSIDVITDENGTIVEELSFDAWGERRNGINWGDLTEAQLLGFLNTDTTIGNGIGAHNVTTRGYTGHEMLDEVGVIHMNGRIYDPKLGRFLQADPFIQDPLNMQSLNRYSYVWNNPLNATDPSGYFVFTLAAIAYTAAVEGLKWYVVGAIFAGAAIADTLIQGGSFKDALKAGLIAGISAGAFSALGGADIGSILGLGEKATRVLAFGALGGVTSVLQGGKFGHGFLSAGISAGLGGNFKLVKGGGWANVGKALARVVIGGTLSKISGGKFANGAMTAAFTVAVQASSIEEVEVGGDSSETEENVEAVREQALEKIDAMITDIAAAQGGDESVLSHLQKYFGEDVNLSSLASEYAEIRGEFASATIVEADPEYIAKRAKQGATVGAYVHQSEYPDTIFYNPAMLGRSDFAALLVHEGAHLAGNGHFKINKKIQYGSRKARKLAKKVGFSATSKNASNYSCAIYMTRDC